MWLGSKLVETGHLNENPEFSRGYDIAFVVVPIAIAVITVATIVFILRSKLTNLEKVILAAVSVVVPLVGAVTALAVTVVLSRRSPDGSDRHAPSRS